MAGVEWGGWIEVDSSRRWRGSWRHAVKRSEWERKMSKDRVRQRTRGICNVYLEVKYKYETFSEFGDICKCC